MTKTTDQLAAVPPQTVQLADPLLLRRGPAFANRLARSALSEALADRAGNPSADLIRLYRRWAVEGGYGLIITGNVMIDRRHLGEPGNVVVEDDRAIEALREWAHAARSGGAKVWAQINHPGRQGLSLLTGNRPVAPSAITSPHPGAQKPRELTDAEVRELVGRYATTAKVFKDAGFDGVQFHGAHGYLISQFLSPLSNQRDDHWGGDAQRRMNFVLEVISETRKVVGEDFPLGIKLNSADFQRGGFSEEQSMGVIDAIARGGAIDLVEISGGTYGSHAMMGQGMKESTRQREAYFQEYAEEVRRRTPDLPLMLTGGFRSVAAMQSALDDGACDVIGFARATCIDPDAVSGLLTGARQHAAAGGSGARLPRWLGRFADLKLVEGAIDLGWYTDQMHRMGAGKEPDPGRSWVRTAARMIRRNGWAALTRRRG